MTPKWLLPEAVSAIHRMLLAEHSGSPGICDPGLLESVLNRPRHRFGYEQDVSMFELAAAYGYGIARNHPLVDGNKRVALAVSAVFLEINGWVLEAPEPETVVVIESLASGELTEAEFARWLQNAQANRPSSLRSDLPAP